ncbi:MAG: phosphatidate cytidylyltransferase [Bacteroidia bacterium]|nr:phosphatidate cytidylyltransferase [Bacteroidia bacterium]
MNNMMQRAITGFFFIGIIISCVLYNVWSFGILLALINLLCIWEYLGITVKENKKLHQISGIITGSLFYVCFVLNIIKYASFEILFIPVILIFCVLIFKLFTKETNPFEGFGQILVSMVYITVPMVLLFKLSFTAYNYFSLIPLLIFISIWSNDTFAYLTGKAFGRNKLFERISPGKTWEGFFGGIICNILIFNLFSYFFLSPKSGYEITPWLIILPIIISVTGTLGDLIESMLKRSYGIKDSGNMLPGHGGFLDRFDALLFLIPFVYVYMQIS